jgi:hypothetical protein
MTEEETPMWAREVIAWADSLRAMLQIELQRNGRPFHETNVQANMQELVQAVRERDLDGPRGPAPPCIEAIEQRLAAERRNHELIAWCQHGMAVDEGCMPGIIRELLCLFLLEHIDGPEIRRILEEGRSDDR